MEDKNPQVILSWKAPLRPYKKRSKMILRFYIALALLLSLIVFFFGDRILILPIWTIIFLFYVLTITPPPIIENRITNFGVETDGNTFRWEILSHFYFTKKFGFNVLTIVTHPPYSQHFFLIVPDEEIKKKIVDILSQHIIYQETPKKSFTDKIVDFFVDLMPEEEDGTNKSNPTTTAQAYTSVKKD
jgi:hypothetical protein